MELNGVAIITLLVNNIKEEINNPNKGSILENLDKIEKTLDTLNRYIVACSDAGYKLEANLAMHEMRKSEDPFPAWHEVRDNPDKYPTLREKLK